MVPTKPGGKNRPGLLDKRLRKDVTYGMPRNLEILYKV
jgi:hypothetical protein